MTKIIEPSLQEKIGIEIDAAMDAEDLESLKSLEIKARLATESADGLDEIELRYVLANAISAKRMIAQRANFNLRSSWDQPDLADEIYQLRVCVKHPSFKDLPSVRKCQILTNLANNFDTWGRPFEAIEAWSAALKIIPNFAMARRNRGFGWLTLAQGLHDNGHQLILSRMAEIDLEYALSDTADWDSIYPNDIKKSAKERLSYIKNQMKGFRTLDDFCTNDYPLGANQKEINLAKWRLENNLFLNPLNEVDRWSLAANDVFHMPNHSYLAAEGPKFVRYFDYAYSGLIRPLIPI